MELESLYDLLQLPKGVEPPAEEMLSQGGKKRYLPPTSRKDPKFEELQKVLMGWINTTLLPEHIVVRSLEEDMFDGLILHHLFQRLAALKLEAEDIALTAASQKHKLAVVLEAVNRSLQLEERQAKWSVETIFNKDLLSTLHLLVALAKRFQPNLSLPTNVQVEVITIESTKSGLKSEKSVEQLTEYSTDKDQPPKDVFDELFKLAPEKVNAVKEAIVNFVNQKLDRLGLSVQNLDTQFADGVILLLLIGQLEGFFLHLKEFYLTPNSPAEMECVIEMLKRSSAEEGGNTSPCRRWRRTMVTHFRLLCLHHPPLQILLCGFSSVSVITLDAHGSLGEAGRQTHHPHDTDEAAEAQPGCVTCLSCTTSPWRWSC
ncbi:gamma-parvin isoform X1 [Piliocolobus tephrosceles]|uniref:Parvin gamma n=1 Tax=Piliocolobus tephrosceles TaxID=591936 RepID=A0A8C9IR55_9PRIM|nr:gamma-parvin isoform X1 [Piliocolobus tephrosceles]XP_023077543.1 gamma-parvin isoform X1 [Piliocolobus tephrosceles]XP_023077544.1 gamma-parvin isoform X1 [Piliocolobus tephrosceles]XP_023077545.1 gamma-parvin isoform X1 [Piliocolobus tephrosceles]XP_023077546.1 gamma-parvin isoform X1 [Piliocolobus tephrosceles]XP_023077547.1 gamma-parvin isoform X1 [Piliocolobus tephrosceles]XP_023077550.1 gamma-parvin isoform X1 [Piliocolobus tephrosceles]